MVLKCDSKADFATDEIWNALIVSKQFADADIFQPDNCSFSVIIKNKFYKVTVKKE